MCLIVRLDLLLQKNYLDRQRMERDMPIFSMLVCRMRKVPFMRPISNQHNAIASVGGQSSAKWSPGRVPILRLDQTLPEWVQRVFFLKIGAHRYSHCFNSFYFRLSPVHIYFLSHRHTRI